MSLQFETMKAFVLTGHGGLDKLEFHDNWPMPKVGLNDVLIRVHACGLNNTDVNTRTAWYSKSVSSETTGDSLETADSGDAAWGQNSLQFPRIQGADVAGTIVEVGKNVNPSIIDKRVMIDTWLRDWNNPGDFASCRYFGSECDGGFAEFTVVDHRQVHPIHCDLSNEEIATFATSWSTAENILQRAKVTERDTVLITGASGGVGSALIQLANRRNAKTIAMTSKSKFEQIEALKPDFIVDRDSENLTESIKDVTGLDSVSVVADIVGGNRWMELIDLLDRGGRYACSGAIAGPIVEFDLRTFYLRDISFFGCTITETGLFANLVGYIERKEVFPILAAVYPLEQLREAQSEFIHKQHIGNIVVKV